MASIPDRRATPTGAVHLNCVNDLTRLRVVTKRNQNLVQHDVIENFKSRSPETFAESLCMTTITID